MSEMNVLFAAMNDICCLTVGSYSGIRVINLSMREFTAEDTEVHRVESQRTFVVQEQLSLYCSVSSVVEKEELTFALVIIELVRHKLSWHCLDLQVRIPACQISTNMIVADSFSSPLPDRLHCLGFHL